MPTGLKSSATESAPPVIQTLVAVTFGAVLLVAARPNLREMPPWIAMAVGLTVLLIPRIGDAVGRAVDRLRHPSRRVRWGIAAVLLVLSDRYFLFSAETAEHPLIPQLHDEFMYLLQARMLSHGRLWMPPLPLAEFFDSFLIVVRPVYAAIYFPGAALCHVPGIWFNVAPSATSLLISGAGVALLYLVITDLTDGVGGLLAALLAVSLEQWRTLSVATLSHPVLLALALATALCLIRWSRAGRWGWALAAGALAGWAAITRPLDALVLILPLAIAAPYVFLRAGGARRRLMVSVGVACLAAAPFLSLQLILNRGVTGHWFTTPVTAYAKANFPGMTIGGSSTGESPSDLPQVRDYYRSFLRPAFLEHAERGGLRTWWIDRLRPAAAVCLPTPWLLLLVPAGLLWVRKPWQVAMAFGILGVTVAYSFVPIYLTHYGLIAAPAFILLVILGTGAISKSTPHPARTAAALAVAIATLALASLPELRGKKDHFFSAAYLVDIDAKLSSLEHTPAVVLFAYRHGADVHEEPVYNLDALQPDDEPVIRAQDRGDDDRLIYAYYAARQPERFFYRYDRVTGKLTALGWAKDLARGPSP